MKLVFIKPDFKIIKFKFHSHISLPEIERQIEAGWSVANLGEKTEINSLVIKSIDKAEVIKRIRQYVFQTMGLAEAKNYVEHQISLGITEFEIRNFN